MCSDCGHRFTRYSHLRRHMSLHSGDKPFMCNTCACHFTRVDHLRRHIKLQHADDNRSEFSAVNTVGGEDIAIKLEVDSIDEAEEKVDSAVVEVPAVDSVARDVRRLSEMSEINELFSLTSRTCSGQLSDKTACCSSETAVMGSD